MTETATANSDVDGTVAIVSQHYPPDKSGNASRIRDTATHLSEKGWDVTVLTPPPAFPHGQFERSWERSRTRVVDGITVQELWAWQPTKQDPGFLSRLAYYLIFPIHALLWIASNHRDVDVIVTSSPPIFTGIVGYPYQKFGGGSWVVDVRDLWIDASVDLGFIESDGVAEKASRRLQRRVLHSSDCITVTTSILGERLQEQYDVEAEKLVSLPNGVETERFTPSNSDPERTIVYTGNVGHAQDLKSCVLALKRLDDDDVSLKIVGDGDSRGELEEFISEHGLEEKVSMRGLVPRDEIPGILDNSMIGIAPLRADSALEYAIPTKVYEYMAAGLPVVATGVGQLEQVLSESNSGYIVENDPDAIASAYRNLLTDEKARRDFGQNGREYVKSNYDRGTIAQRLSETLQGLRAEHPQTSTALTVGDG